MTAVLAPAGSPLVAVPGRQRPEDCGRKAANVAWLGSKGWPVPAGIAVPASAAARLREPTAAAEIAAAVEAALGPGPFAVRSSADVEDAVGHSFAGQFLTVLDVPAGEGLAAAMAAVADSANRPAVRSYAERMQVLPEAIRMAVLVQRMVPAAAAGVAFSRNPLSGLDEVVIEAVQGRGDALVDGGVTPDRWVFRWGDFSERPAAPRVDPGLVETVAREARRIAAAYGNPIDVEWVHDGTSLHWVQVRPMAGLDGIGLYSNRIAREVLPGQIKPLVWSVNVPVVNGAWVDLITEAIGPNDIDPASLARSFGYRAYFDMGELGRVFVALGMPRDSLELLLGLPGGTERPRFKPTRATWRHLPRLLRLVWRLNRYDRRLDRELPAIRAEYDSLAARDLAGLSDRALLERVDHLMVVTRRAAYANIVAPLLLNAYGALIRRRSRALGVDGARVDPARGLDSIRAYDPRHHLDLLARELARLPAPLLDRLRAEGYAATADPAYQSLRDGLDEHLRRFGHLGDSGNDFSSPRWGEAPDLVVGMLLAHVEARGGSGQDGAAVAGADAGQSIGPEELELRTRGVSRLILRRLLRRAATFRLQREAVSSIYTFGYALFRGTFLELGRRLVDAGRLTSVDDIFLLTLDELRQLLTTGLPDPAPIASARRAEMAEAETLDLPETILGSDYVPRQKVRDAGADGGPVGSRRGVPSSRGTHRGTARVIRALADSGRLGAGDVLVIPFSDVAWTPLFARAGAVVAESGGMLSHSSIVAREHGIPCVVSVADAMSIPDGATVHVDGYTGDVTVESAGTVRTNEGAGLDRPMNGGRVHER